MQLPDLAAFLAVATERSFSAAARLRSPVFLNTSRTWRGTPSSGTRTAVRWPRAISVIAQRRGSSATPMPVSTARLIPSRLGSAI